MSFTVTIIPEDPRYNGYIVKPVVRALLTDVGKPHAKVDVFGRTVARGYYHVFKHIDEICGELRSENLVLFLPDRDGDVGRDESLRHLTKKKQTEDCPFVAVAAVEEVEVWLLAGHKHTLDIKWNEVRDDPHVKETVFKRFMERHGDSSIGRGRRALMSPTISNLSGLLDACPELEVLRSEIKKLV